MKHAPVALAYLEDRLLDLERQGLLRTRPESVPEVGRSFCSNDYLGLAAEPGLAASSGAGASRLIVGERPEHRALEEEIASWLGVPAALLFSSGYAANVGTVSALLEPGDLVVSDQLNHASLIDGCRLGRAQVEIVPHLDVDAVRRALGGRGARRAFVLTESYFSMDADTPDLPALRAVTQEHDAALLVDEAHAIGVFGPGGRGLCAENGVVPDILVGTLGKAFGAAGAFVAGSRALVAWLWNRARSFVFSTGVSPLVASAALRALRLDGQAADRRARLHENASALRVGLQRLGVQPAGVGPILPIIIGDSDRALRAAAELRARGVHVQAVRPPTVPAGTARLRVTTTALHSREDIDRALSAFGSVLPWLHRSS